jgi:RimJ/RimL family protein N-acetyltransferase
MARRINPAEQFAGKNALLRLVTMDDCTQRYVDWLLDPEVHRYLETRWSPQSLDTVRSFVGGLIDSPSSYLFAIVAPRVSGGPVDTHVGNIKIGPIDAHHACADVSYFVGERDAWGKGIASDAVAIATRIAFERLELHRLQAGAYSSNVASTRVLEKSGYRIEGRLRGRLRAGDAWEDHLWYGLLREEWLRRASS